MSKTRRNHSPQFKAKVAIEALAGDKTIHEIAAKHQVHPTQVTQWRRQLIDQAAEVFGKSSGKGTADDREALLAKIGELTVEKDFWLFSGISGCNSGLGACQEPVEAGTHAIVGLMLAHIARIVPQRTTLRVNVFENKGATG